MSPELDQLDPMGQTSPGMDNPALPNGDTDREGAMAKADLYKLANYSHKLFQQINDEDQLEGWVQAKITKAADYIASVYHYLEYEMKFSEYGKRLDDSDVLSEGQKAVLKGRLMEAKVKMKELKKAQAEKAKEKKVDEGVLSGGEETCTECGGSGMIYREAMPVPDHVKSKVDKYKRLTKATHAAHKRLDLNNNGIPDDEEFEENLIPVPNPAGAGSVEKAKELGAKYPQQPTKEGFDDKSKEGDTFKTKTGVATKTSSGVKHANTSYKDDGEAEEKSGKGVKSHAKAQSAAEKKEKAPAQKFSPKSAKTYGMKDGEKFDNRDGAPAKSKKEKDVSEGSKMRSASPKDMPAKGNKIGKEGNAFGKAVQDAKASGDKTMTVGGKTMPVKEGERTMSRAAKGHEKYGKEGMAALAKAGREGKDLDKVRDKYDKYDESVESDGKKKCPPMSHIKKMCQDGKSVAEICKMHPDCDQKELKQMVADCKSKLGEASMPMKKVNGKSVPAFAADGKGKNDLSKKKDVKEAAAAMWNNMKETVAYMAEKKAATKNLPGNQEKIDVAEPKGKIDGKDMAALRAKKETVKESSDLTRMRELTGRLNLNENVMVKKTGEVDQLKALTNLFKG